eukprot:6457794-Prymnesium_polylepis.1
MLGLIVDFVRGKPQRALAPPPREVLTLWRHLRLEHGEALAARGQVDDLSVANRTLTVENERLRRLMESNRARAEREMQAAARQAAAADERSEEVRDGAAKWRRMQERAWEQQRKEERRAATQAARE